MVKKISSVLAALLVLTLAAPFGVAEDPGGQIWSYVIDPETVRKAFDETGTFSVSLPSDELVVQASEEDLVADRRVEIRTEEGLASSIVDLVPIATAGSVVGVPGSEARVVLGEYGLYGFVRTPGTWYWLDPELASDGSYVQRVRIETRLSQKVPVAPDSPSNRTVDGAMEGVVGWLRLPSVGPSPAAVGGPNALQNGGFESGMDDWWTYGDAGPCSFSTTSAWSNTGSWSARIQDTSGSAACGIYQTVYATEGEELVAHGHFRTVSVTGGVQIYLEWLNLAGQRLRLDFSTVMDLGTFSMAASGVAPTGTAYARVWVYVPSGSQADVNIDDVSLKLVTGANQLANAGFESGLTSWTAWGSCTVSASNEWSNEGLGSAKMVDPSGSVACGLYQEVAASPGQELVARAVYRTTQITNGIQIHLKWLNSAGSVLRTDFSTAGDLGTFTLSASGIAPTGTSKVQVWMYSPTASTTTAYSDSFVLKSVATNLVTSFVTMDANAAFRSTHGDWASRILSAFTLYKPLWRESDIDLRIKTIRGVSVSTSTNCVTQQNNYKTWLDSGNTLPGSDAYQLWLGSTDLTLSGENVIGCAEGESVKSGSLARSVIEATEETLTDTYNPSDAEHRALNSAHELTHVYGQTGHIAQCNSTFSCNLMDTTDYVRRDLYWVATTATEVYYRYHLGDDP